MELAISCIFGSCDMWGWRKKIMTLLIGLWNRELFLIIYKTLFCNHPLLSWWQLKFILPYPYNDAGFSNFFNLFFLINSFVVIIPEKNLPWAEYISFRFLQMLLITRKTPKNSWVFPSQQANFLWWRQLAVYELNISNLSFRSWK